MKELQHGKPGTYNNHGCRCDKCKKAWREYMGPRVKAWRDKKKKTQKKGVRINL